MDLIDVATERFVLSGLFTYGHDAYVDISDILQNDSFTEPLHQTLYKVIQTHFEKNANKIDLPTLFSLAKPYNIEGKDDLRLIRAIFNTPIEKESVRNLAGKIRKLQILRGLVTKIDGLKENVLSFTGEEPLSESFGLAESFIFDYINGITDDCKPKKLCDGASELLDYFVANPCDIPGVSTCYPKLDFAFGGGLREGNIHVCVARMKCGKSFLGMNVGLNTSGNGHPTLYVDTEMEGEEVMPRAFARLTGIKINNIERGQINEVEIGKIRTAIKQLDRPFYHVVVKGMAFPEILSIIRRWYLQVAKHYDKTPVVIYDYFKMMDSNEFSKNLNESQLLGFQFSSLHNFLGKYKCACLAFAQQNRTGIKEDDSGTVFGTDRIAMYCASLGILRKKTQEELDEDPKSGNRKFIPLFARYGEDFPENSYINYNFDGSVGLFKEGRLSTDKAVVEEKQFTVEDDGEIQF